VLEGYEDWAEAHQLDLQQPRTLNEMVDQIEQLVGIEVGDLNLRHQAVLNMLHQEYHDPPHALQTATLALQLFDQLRPLHGLGAAEAELFEFGVLLHNVGEHGEERDRHVRTAAMIRESNLPGFTRDELNVISVIAAAHTIHHQRELEAWLATVPSVHRPMVEKLAPLARLADGMDASHEQTVRWVEAILADEGKLIIRMQSRTKAKQEVRATRERSHLIERVYGLEVEVLAERQGPPPATTQLAPLSLAPSGRLE
jgi:exopolyphosphatase/guanosine-5'-triphosphate,3'-diphosphate pyrophosphatase